MVKIELYTKPYCPYCVKAKNLLKSKGVEFTEYDITDDDIRAEMIRRLPDAKTVPQIFIGDRLIGGYTELVKLEDEDRLDKLLKQQIYIN